MGIRVGESLWVCPSGNKGIGESLWVCPSGDKGRGITMGMS